MIIISYSQEYEMQLESVGYRHDKGFIAPIAVTLLEFMIYRDGSIC